MSEQLTNGWVNHFMTLAKNGDSDSQIAIAWAYYRGKELPFDIGESERWFRRAAAAGAGEMAYFNLLKMLIIAKSDRCDDVYREQDWNLGAIHYIYGQFLIKRGRKEKDVLQIFQRAAEKGNLYAKLETHIIQSRGLSRLVFFHKEIKILIEILIAHLKADNKSNLLFR